MNRLARSLGTLLVLGFIQSTQLLWFPRSTQAQVSSGALCAVPGKDGIDLGAINIVNSYFPGSAKDKTVVAGSTTIPVGSINSSGSQTAISPGDLLLIIQMQDADINYTDTSNYGAGNGTGSGSTDIHSTGLYEYVVANNSVGAGGGDIQIRGTTGLLNTYRQEAATATHGQRTYQVVRVPQYTNTTLSGTIRSPGAWNGTSGGIVVIDVANTFTFSNGTVEVQDKGFRGGGGTTNTDTYPDKEDEAFRTDGGVPRGGVKGEGIAGTPLYVFDGTNTTNTGVDGYPRTASQDSYTTITTGATGGGSRARGAPGNAGGGGDMHNSGGGGGGNWGAGGQGGNSINSPPIDETPSTGVSKPVGGRGGAPFTTATVKRLAMGGGGGAGDANNGVAGSGGLGGGIVLIRAGTITGTGSISARARDGVVTPTDDGGSGAGAGGSISITAKGGSLAGIVLNAKGGKGGDTNTNTTVPYDFGPGGGGGGGVIFSSLPVSTATVSGGQPGKSFNGQLGGSTGVTRSAAAGTDGKIEITGTTSSNATGVSSGADCSVTLSGQVWKDTDGSITKDASEVGTDAGGLSVYLVDSSGNVLAKSSVQSDGTYSIVAPINTNATLRLSTDGTKNYGQVAPAASLPSGWVNTGENKNGVTETVTPGEIAIATATSSIANQNFGLIEYPSSPYQGQIVINEVLYNQSGENTAAANDEFIELYNASSVPVDMTGWKLTDGNLIATPADSPNLDGKTGSITGTTSPFIFGNAGFVTSGPLILQPGQYAVIWVGNPPESSTASTNSPGATFQAWLKQGPQLNNSGDDVWLYDSQTRIIDYVAFGIGSAINTRPLPLPNFWNAAYESKLTPNKGQSISLTPNGQDGNTSACWEPTTSGEAKSPRCPGFLPTRDTDPVVIGTDPTAINRVTSVGVNNNGLSTNLLLVKRITSINGSTTAGSINLATYNQIEAYPYDDNVIETNLTSTTQYPMPDTDKWPNTTGKATSSFLLGAVNGGDTKPKDEIEYTIYFLSAGTAPAQRVTLCDRIPANQTLVPNGYNSVTQATGGNQTDRGIAVSYAGNYQSYTNLKDGDTAQYFAPQTALPAACGTAANTTGAVVVNLGAGATNALGGTIPQAIAPDSPTDSYGFVRFKAKVN
jgi:uncharacterized repeat protein (TIGR01451 family)